MQKVLDSCLHDELLECVNNEDSKDKTTYRPTEKGWLLGNELYGRLWDLR